MTPFSKILTQRLSLRAILSEVLKRLIGSAILALALTVVLWPCAQAATLSRQSQAQLVVGLTIVGTCETTSTAQTQPQAPTVVCDHGEPSRVDESSESQDRNGVASSFTTSGPSAVSTSTGSVGGTQSGQAQAGSPSVKIWTITF